MKRPLHQIDEHRYRHVELWELGEQKTTSDFLIALLGFGLIWFFAWLLGQ